MKYSLFLFYSILFITNASHAMQTENISCATTEESQNKNFDNALTKKRNIYFVILAGGSGTRLWPLSTSKCPKQLLTLDNNKTLLQQTINLVRTYDILPTQIWVSTSPNHAELIETSIGSLIDHIIIEPSARNTGPAILYSCLRIYDADPDAIILFLPADSYIPDNDIPQVITAMEQIFSFVSSHEAIALLGIEPTHPATGYGYIEYDGELFDKHTGVHKVKNFHEKPNSETAQEYIQHPTMLWNIGMFGAQVSVFLQEFKRYAPDLYQAIFNATYHNESFNEIPSISIDYALIELSQCIHVLPVAFSWCDVGNIKTFLSLKQQISPLTKKLLSHNSSNNLVNVSDKLVALIGIHDLCVVQTENVLLIMHANEIENVNTIVYQLKEQEWYEYI